MMSSCARTTLTVSSEDWLSTTISRIGRSRAARRRSSISWEISDALLKCHHHGRNVGMLSAADEPAPFGAVSRYRRHGPLDDSRRALQPQQRRWALDQIATARDDAVRVSTATPVRRPIPRPTLVPDALEEPRSQRPLRTPIVPWLQRPDRSERSILPVVGVNFNRRTGLICSRR